MNCEEVSELLPAYVIGALEADEIEALEEHLRQGSEHEEELVRLRATVFALDRFELDVEPSPALSQRVREVAEPVPAIITMPDRRTVSLFEAFGLRTAVAAIVLLLVFAAGMLAGGLAGSGDDEVLAFALQGQDGAFMEVRGSTSADSVTVTMAGLERLTGLSYQVWATRDGSWQSIGVCNTNAEGAWVGDFPVQLRSGQGVALTIEPAGGSQRPTSEPILQSVR